MRRLAWAHMFACSHKKQVAKPGRKYEEAVKTFQPYDKVKERNPDDRAAGKALIAEGKAAGPERKTFIHVNNRLEGNAIETIDAMISDADR